MENEQALVTNEPEKAEFRYQSENEKFKEAIKQITKILRACHPSYDGTKYIFRQVRKNLDLEAVHGAKGVKEHLSREEAERIIGLAYERKGHVGLLLKILLFTGCRINEFVNIKLEDVHLGEANIFIRQGKGGKQRYVPVFNFLLHELKTYIGDRERGYLFESNRHDKYSTRRIQQILKQLAKEAGVSNPNKPVHPHMFRRTIATWLRDRNVPLEQIQLFLGHEKLDTTLLYAKGSIAKLSSDMNKALVQPGDFND